MKWKSHLDMLASFLSFDLRYARWFDDISPLPFPLSERESLMVFYTLRFSHLAFRKSTPPPSFFTRPPHQTQMCPAGHFSESYCHRTFEGLSDLSPHYRGGRQEYGDPVLQQWGGGIHLTLDFSWFSSRCPEFLLAVTITWSFKIWITSGARWK